MTTTPLPGYPRGKPDMLELHAIDYMDELETVWGRRWDGQSELGKLKLVMVSRPTTNETSAEVAADPEFYGLPHGVPNLPRMQKQHEVLVGILKGEGIEVVNLDVPEDARGPYARMRTLWAPASAFVIRGGAILPRYGKAAYRRGFEVLIGKKLMELGCPILYTVHGKGVLEAGGVCQWIDPEHLVIGMGRCANLEAVEQVRPILTRAGVREIHLAQLRDVWHIDLCFTLAAPWVAVVYPRWMDEITMEYLRRKKIDLIEVDDDEARRYACNLQVLEPGKVIMPGDCPRTSKALRERGIDVIEWECSEFVKAHGGGPHCAVAPLVREPGPLLGG
jgi:N-dimethylarginine dimethylaminohydrolase